MRILHVVPVISQKLGGPSTIPGLVRCLTDHGVDATLLTTNADPDGRLDVPLNGPVTRDGAVYTFHNVLTIGGRWGLSPSIVTTLRRTMASYDLVHIHWLYNFACIAAARAAIAANVPFVVQPHGSLDPHLRKKNWLVKQAYLATVGRPLLTRAAAVVFTSEQERVLASYGPRRPEWVVPAGLDGASFAHLPPRGTFRGAFPAVDGPFLLFVGRLSRQKGLDLLIGAFARLARQRPDLWLVLAGPDPDGYGAHVRVLSEQLGVSHRVVFTGMLTHELKLAAYIDADLFVLPSYAENFGVVITEALACGLPVVISDQVNIHRELAAAGAASVVPCSVDSVAAGIASALSDTGARGRIATLGPALVRAHYTWEAIIPMLVARYADVIARSARVRAHGAHTRMRRAFRPLLPRTIRPRRIVAGPLRGTWLVTSWRDYPAGLTGRTERPLLGWFASHVRPGDTWLDVGAHYGYTAFALARLVGPSGRVFTFEPVAATAGCIDQGRVLNGLSHLTVLPFGLGAADTLEVRRLATARGMADSRLSPDAEQFVDVSVARFDWLWPLVNGGNGAIHGVKIDVQGMELDTLYGMREALTRWRPRVVVELHAGVSRERVLALLREAGYSSDAVAIEPVRGERTPLFLDDHSYAFHPA